VLAAAPRRDRWRYRQRAAVRSADDVHRRARGGRGVGAARRGARAAGGPEARGGEFLPVRGRAPVRAAARALAVPARPHPWPRPADPLARRRQRAADGRALERHPRGDAAGAVWP
jgi:hypothetical protein